MGGSGGGRPGRAARGPVDNDGFYKELGIEKSASESEIKKAYRKLAIKWHPDKCKASNANDIFSNISTAYEILYDEDSKRKYDRELRLASTIASVASCTTTMYNTVEQK